MLTTDGVLTGEQVRVPECLLERTLHELIPGGWAFVDDSTVFYDHERNLWLDGSVPLDESDPVADKKDNKILIICFDPGLVVNFFRSYLPPNLASNDLDEYSEEEGMGPIPVIEEVRNEEKDRRISELYLRAFGIKLDEALKPKHNQPRNTTPRYKRSGRVTAKS